MRNVPPDELSTVILLVPVGVAGEIVLVVLPRAVSLATTRNNQTETLFDLLSKPAAAPSRPE